MAYIIVGISDEPVELFAFQNKRVVARLDDAAFGSNGSRCVDIVPGDHPDRNSGLLTFPNRLWHFWTHGIFDADDAQTSHIVNDLFFIIPIGFGIDMNLQCDTS